jgi:hypothetical protein
MKDTYAMSAYNYAMSGIATKELARVLSLCSDKQLVYFEKRSKREGELILFKYCILEQLNRRYL